MVAAQLIQDQPVRGRVGLGPDIWNPELQQQRGGQDAGLEVSANGHYRRVKLTDAEFFEGCLISRVGSNRVGELLRHVLDDALIGIHSQHLVPGLH